MARKPQYPTPEAEYVQSPAGISLRDLAQKWGISVNTLSHQSSTRNWVEKRRAFQHDLTAKSTERALKQGSEAFAEELAGEERDLKEIRQLLVHRLNPEDVPDTVVAITRPDAYAKLVGALVAIDKQLCLRRGIRGAEDGDGRTILVSIVPLEAKGAME